MRLMISLLMAGFLVACGEKDADTATEEVEETEEVVEEGSEETEE